MVKEIFQPGTVKPEEDYLELERLGTKLGIPMPMMHIEVSATNPDGSQGDYYKDRSRTFNRNFWNMVFGMCASSPSGSATFGSGFLAVKNTAGTVFANTTWQTAGLAGTNNTVGPIFGTGIGTNGTAAGIVVGTGTTAESFENTTLVTLIASGNGSGQLSYTAQTASTAAYTSGSKLWTGTNSRIFNNNSGGTIVVAETGLYAGFNGSTHMIERSLLGATVSVLNAGQLTVTYTMTLTFPA